MRFSRAISRRLIAYADMRLARDPHSWRAPGQAALTALLRRLAPIRIESINDRLCVTTLDGTRVLGPPDASGYGISRDRFDMVRTALRVTGLPLERVDDAGAALLHDAILRYLTEFSSYPYLATRTASLRPGDVFVDIGAFRGYVTIKAARTVGSAGRVIAVEAIAANATFITAHTEVNDVRNVDVLTAAVTLDGGEVAAFYTTERQGNAAVSSHLAPHARTVAVPNLSVADLASRICATGSDRAVLSVTTNGTELGIVGKLLDEFAVRGPRYLEFAVPTIYFGLAERIAAEALAKRMTHVVHEYPWLRLVRIR